jgi:hypothetical protein
MPFASLRGYYDMINNSDVEVCEKKELSEEEKLAISDVLSSLTRGDVITVKYYELGAYLTKSGAVSKVSKDDQTLTIIKTPIPFDDILSIERN